MALNSQKMSAAEFKAKCLKLMDNVESDRTEVIITKRGKPIAKLVPYQDNLPPLFGCMAGTIEILGDIISPIDLAWNAEHD